MYDSNKALTYFTINCWDFKITEFMKLPSFLRNEDVKSFDYRDFWTSDVISMMTQNTVGIRRYLFHEKDESMPQARKLFHRFKIANDIVKTIFRAIFVFVIAKILVKML